MKGPPKRTVKFTSTLYTLGDIDPGVSRRRSRPTGRQGREWAMGPRQVLTFDRDRKLMVSVPRVERERSRKYRYSEEISENHKVDVSIRVSHNQKNHKTRDRHTRRKGPT